MLDDLKRALRMESPTPRLSENNLRKLSRGFRSSKKSRLSAASDVESSNGLDGGLAGRSASLSTLLPSGGSTNTTPRRPRVEKLQTVEAKMASIEVSLGWRKRREVLLETLPRAARELVRELDTLHQTLRDKDGTIQSLRTQITNLGGSVKAEAPPAGTASSPGCAGGVAVGGAPCLTGPERRRVEERISKVNMEIESKKVAVKNLRLTLDKIDMTDNIDVRIRAAEMEYELEREELNILNLREEVGVLQSRLQETTSTSTTSTYEHGALTNGAANGSTDQTNGGKEITGNTTSHDSSQAVVNANDCCSPGTLHDLLCDHDSLGATSVLAAVTVNCTAGNPPPFHVSSRVAGVGCVIDWATDDTRLKKGDKLVEVNGVAVHGSPLEDVLKIIAGHGLVDVVVLRVLPDYPHGIPGVGMSSSARRPQDDRSRELRELQTKLDRALREKEEIKNDKTRLTHRISYLEDQVTELETTFKKTKDSSSSGASASSSSLSSSPAPSSPGTTVIQVYQKGQQTLAVARPRQNGNSTAESNRKYPTLSYTSPSRSGDHHMASVGSPPRRASSSSSSKSSSTHNPSSASSSSGYASYTSFRSSTSQGNHRGVHYETMEAIRLAARPSSSTEHRRPRRILSPRPDSRNELESRLSSLSKPMPPKKPERLSLQRATSLLSVDQVSTCSSRSTRRPETATQEDLVQQSQAWKSTGNGLNNNSNELDVLDNFASASPGNMATLKYRTEFVSRRDSSPLPAFYHCSRDVMNNNVNRNSYKSHTDTDVILREDMENESAAMDVALKNNSQEEQRSSHCSENDRNQYQTASSWSPGVDRHSGGTTSPYLTASSSSYLTPSSEGSSCGSSGRPVESRENSPLQETLSVQLMEDASNLDTSNSSLTPTNTPKSSPPKALREQDISQRSHSSIIQKVDQAFPYDITLVHAEPTYGYLPFKQTNHSGSITKANLTNQTLSSMHNQRNNNITNTYRSNSHSNVYPTRGGSDDKYTVAYNDKHSSFSSASKAKENYPVNSYIYGSNSSSNYESYSSLKRHTGRTGAGVAPSTPVTPRSNSSMKLRSPKNGQEDWC